MLARLCPLIILALLGGCRSPSEPAPAPPPPMSLAPEPLSPSPGQIFSHFPRTTELRWKPVEGAGGYFVEIDCFNCCEMGKWCVDVGKPNWLSTGRLATTSYTFNWVGANAGRWRVWAIAEGYKQTPKSEWHEFRYLQ